MIVKKERILFSSFLVTAFLFGNLWAQASLTSMLEEEEPFYLNYGLEPYAKEEIQSEMGSQYDRFGSHITDGFTVYHLYSDNQHIGRSADPTFDSTIYNTSNEIAYSQFFENFNNLIMTRDAIGGSKSTFLIGDQIRTRFTPFTLNRLNYKGIRWDIWTSGLKFTSLVSRTRPGSVAMASTSNMSPVTFPLVDGSFVNSGTVSTWLGSGSGLTDEKMTANFREQDYSNKSPYGDYDFLWAFHAENDLANVLQYGITFMNHNRNDISQSMKFKGDIPDAWVPEEIHFEFYDMTPHRTDDAGCYVEDVQMTLNGNVAAGGPTGVYTIDPNDSTFYRIKLPRVQSGWEPVVTTFYPANPQIPNTLTKEQIQHVTFTYTVAGNYLVFVSTDKYIPLAIRAAIDPKVSPRSVVYYPPETKPLEKFIQKNVPITASSPSGYEGPCYFGDYIAKAPHPVQDPVILSVPATMTNRRTYTYEFTIDVNSMTYGANFKGKLFGVNFSGEIATNTREGKYPGPNNLLEDYKSRKIRRNVFQFKADRDIAKKLNLSGEVYRIDPNWETNLKLNQPSRYLSRVTYTFPRGSWAYLTYPKPLCNDWRAIDDNEDQDLYVENGRRPYPSNYSQGDRSNFSIDGYITASLVGGSGQADSLYLPTKMNMIYDDEDGVISNRYDRNKNSEVDYREDFLLFYTDPPVFELENDMNFNGMNDYEDDDLLPDYPYQIPYTITSNAIMMHGLQGLRAKLKIEPLSGLVCNVGTRLENGLNMNITEEKTITDDKPGDDEGKSKIFYGNGMLKITRRSEGIDYFLGDEVYMVQDAIRNDIIQTGGGLDIKNITGWAYHFLTDQLRYRNAVVNNLVAGLTYVNIPNLEVNTRIMLGYEQHLGIKNTLFYVTKTRADYTYESFWETYPDRSIAKSYLVHKMGYTQKWNLEYEGWKSLLNLANRLTIEPQYKISYEFRRNLKTSTTGEEKDPRKEAQYERPDFLTDLQKAEYRNRWQEFDANTDDYLLSVPILRCNFQIAEKTLLEGGVEWMRAFDRITEANSLSNTHKILQVVSRDNYAGYNIALILGMDSYSIKYDVNLRDGLLGTGKYYNDNYSQVFAQIFAGL